MKTKKLIYCFSFEREKIKIEKRREEIKLRECVYVRMGRRRGGKKRKRSV